MSTLSMSYALVVVAAAGAGSAAAWVSTALHYRGQLVAAGSRVEQAELAKQKAQELAVQSRQQVESLQQALSEAKRNGAIHTASTSARAAAAAAEAAKAVQAKKRADLMAQLEADDHNDSTAHGFADTQPLHN